MIVTTHVCNACNGEIRFIDRKPHNKDGSLHWDVCKERQFKAVMRKGVPYSTDSEGGYVYKGKRVATWRDGPRIVGSKYKPSSCDCGIPPWEVCQHSF